MLFNSLEFAIFFLIVYGLYLISKHKRQNMLLLIGSYVFYGAWDWRFLFLIFTSTILDYFCGLKIYATDNIKKRKLFLFLSIFGNLAILGFFKYFNFFAGSLQNLLGNFNISICPRFLNIVLPVGISFYTFQTMSYTIDIYRREMNPTRKFFDFALFVAFFPQLVAGPIERAKHLLPQILSPRVVNLDKFYEGCYLIFWGLFLKIVVADNLARIVELVFVIDEPPYNGIKVVMALYAFAYQIFCDFAGYSNIARGLGKCMGFDIMINFKLPYFVTNPREFWQRWHLSLSSWLRDYLYIPLGGNRRGRLITFRNLFVTMLLGGLWHGAAGKFVIWGAYHGLLLFGYRLLQPLLGKIMNFKNAIVNKVWFFVRIVFFFHLVCLGWLIFRAESMSQAFNMLYSIIFNFRFVEGIGLTYIGLKIAFFVWVVLAVQLFQSWKNDLMAIYKSNYLIRALFYYVCFRLMLYYGITNEKFIYFVF